MSAVIVVAIVLIVLLAALMVLSATKRREMGSATGELSRETLRRDASRRKSAKVAEGEAVTGRSVEKAVVLARSGGAVVASGSSVPTLWVPPDPETIGVTRRQFLNRSMVAVMGLAITTFAAAAFTAFLWPTGKGGFGGKIVVGKITDIKANIVAAKGFLYVPEGRMWITPYPDTALPKAQLAYGKQTCYPGMQAGIVCLWQKCPHLGCRVPNCNTSQWFECPCHGSQYNHVGEKKGGPAPRGMDRFGVEVSGDGVVTVNTGDVNLGPPIGTNTTGQEAEGPHCR